MASKQFKPTKFKDLLFELNNLKKYQNSPKVDLRESNKQVNVRVELAGMCENDISIKLKDSQFLLISGNKQKSEDVSFTNTVYEECYYGNFVRRVKLPTLVDNLFIKQFKNGVYYITLNKIQITYSENIKETTIQMGQEIRNMCWADE